MCDLRYGVYELRFDHISVSYVFRMNLRLKVNAMEVLDNKTTKALPLIRPYGSEAVPVWIVNQNVFFPLFRFYRGRVQKEKNKFVRFNSVSFLSSRSSIASYYVIEKRKFTFFIYLLISTLNIKL
jgi:hypothetical protein